MTSINIYAQDPEDRGERREDNFYPTEPEATHALVKVERPRLVKVCRTGRQLEAERKKIAKMQREWSRDCRKPYPDNRWKDKMIARLRQGYDGKTMLVPGVPEADTSKARCDALIAFKKWAVK